MLSLVSRGQTAFFRFYLWWRKKTEKSGLATRDYAVSATATEAFSSFELNN